MSRAFVKEDDGRSLDAGLPRPQSPWTNYVTPRGLQALQDKLKALLTKRDRIKAFDELHNQTAKASLERELLFVGERLKRAVLVDPKNQSLDTVHFGAKVEVTSEEGVHQKFMIVGEDEADAETGRISWVSPLARALLGAEVGDWVVWSRPMGDIEIEVITIARGESHE